MLGARTPVLLGRWGTRDFLRGRSKKGGAVHIRHTHGSKGRYKRLSTHFGLRDGRRHAGNRLKGGLGVKIGGGLFGLRLPRQHALSTLTKEEFELEVYGHPNITNPYRELMEEHPALRLVMENAAPRAEMVVLMPRAPRHPRTVQTVSTKAGDREGMNKERTEEDTVALPATWEMVAKDLAALLRSHAHASCVAAISFCTLDSTARLVLPGAGRYTRHEDTAAAAPSSHLGGGGTHIRGTRFPCAQPTDSNDFEEQIQAALRRLYASYQRGRRLNLSEQEPGSHTAAQASPSTRGRKPFMGATLRSQAAVTPVLQPPGTAQRSAAPGLASSALLQARRLPSFGTTAAVSRLEAMAASTTSRMVSTRNKDVRTDDITVSKVGDTSAVSPGTRCHDTTVEGGRKLALTQTEATVEQGASAVVCVEEGVANVWRSLKQRHPNALCLCLRPLSLGDLASSNPSLSDEPSSSKRVGSSDVRGHRVSSETASPSSMQAVPLLKKDIDAQAEVGVWRRSRARSSTSALLKWFYSTHDPRAHSGDAIPHAQRRLPVLLLVDASRLGTTLSSPRDERESRVAVPSLTPSLLSQQMSEELERIGFLAVADNSVSAVVNAMAHWATERQWALMLALKEEAMSETAATASVRSSESVA